MRTAAGRGDQGRRGGVLRGALGSRAGRAGRRGVPGAAGAVGGAGCGGAGAGGAGRAGDAAGPGPGGARAGGVPAAACGRAWCTWKRPTQRWTCTLPRRTLRALGGRAAAPGPPAWSAGWSDASVAGYRVCVRPMPADGRSIVGPLPGADGLYVAVTHSGVTLAAHLAGSSPPSSPAARQPPSSRPTDLTGSWPAPAPPAGDRGHPDRPPRRHAAPGRSLGALFAYPELRDWAATPGLAGAAGSPRSPATERTAGPDGREPPDDRDREPLTRRSVQSGPPIRMGRDSLRVAAPRQPGKRAVVWMV